MKLSSIDEILDYRRLIIILQQIFNTRLQFARIHDDGFRIQADAAVLQCRFDYRGKQAPNPGRRFIIIFPGWSRNFEEIERPFGFDFISAKLQNIGR